MDAQEEERRGSWFRKHWHRKSPAELPLYSPLFLLTPSPWPPPCREAGLQQDVQSLIIKAPALPLPGTVEFLQVILLGPLRGEGPSSRTMPPSPLYRS